MKKLLTYQDRFDVIYPSHSTLPVEKDLIAKLIEGAQEIADGKAQGKEVDVFGNKVMLYQFPYAGFLGDCSK